MPKDVDEEGRRSTITLARELYARASDPENPLPGGSLIDEVREELRYLAESGRDQESLAEWEDRACAWASAEMERFRALHRDTIDEKARSSVVRGAALDCAPLMLTAGAWLQWMSSPGNADEPVVLRSLGLYASDVGVGHPRAARGSAYLAILRKLLLSEYAGSAAHLSLDQRIPDGSFYLPALLLGMSRRPEDYRGELMGADLCLRTTGFPPPLAVVAEGHPDLADWSIFDLGSARDADSTSALATSRDMVHELLVGRGDGDAERVLLGFRWTLAALRRWSDAVHESLRTVRDPAQEMAELLRSRAREGAVYHHKFRMEGRALSDWLQGC